MIDATENLVFDKLIDSITIISIAVLSFILHLISEQSYPKLHLYTFPRFIETTLKYIHKLVPKQISRTVMKLI